MQGWYIPKALCKGLVLLILVLIILEYLFAITKSENLVFTKQSYCRSQYNENEVPNSTILSKILSKLTTASKYVQEKSNSNVNGSEVQDNYQNLESMFDLTSEKYKNSTNMFRKSRYSQNSSIPNCPDDPPDLLGKLAIHRRPVPTTSQLEEEFTWLKPGGHYRPSFCNPASKVAIIVPYRCRGEHLLLFLQHMHPFLKRQQLDYTIFIIEQDGNGVFNRALLMNVGYMEALKKRNFDCFIFHDIDLLPENDRNLYTCPIQPRHMSVAVDIFRYKLPYPEIFGGVSAITRDHFKLLNGFSNSFWGWGGEDDDMSNRIRHHHLFISRYPPSIARYTMLTHKKDTPNPSRYDNLRKGQKKYDVDGLNNLKYKVRLSKENLLFTWFLIEVEPPS